MRELVKRVIGGERSACCRRAERSESFQDTCYVRERPRYVLRVHTCRAFKTDGYFGQNPFRGLLCTSKLELFLWLRALGARGVGTLPSRSRGIVAREALWHCCSRSAPSTGRTSAMRSVISRSLDYCLYYSVYCLYYSVYCLYCSVYCLYYSTYRLYYSNYSYPGDYCCALCAMSRPMSFVSRSVEVQEYVYLQSFLLQ